MLGLFGGTFNPIHNGHLSMAAQARDLLGLKRVEFIPCHQPVHRNSPLIPGSQRAKMIELAIVDTPSFALNRIELDRGGASYMVDTLQAIRLSELELPLCLLLGTDAFNGFQSWREPETILELCHLVVCQRPDNLAKGDIFPTRQTRDLTLLSQARNGRILLLDMTTNDCSSTGVRTVLASGQTKHRCLPQPVLDFIVEQQLYGSGLEPRH